MQWSHKMKVVPLKFILGGSALLIGILLVHQGCSKQDSVSGAGGGAADSLTTYKRQLKFFWKASGRQPIAFDHQAHIKAEDMNCLDCHKNADKGSHATLPKLKDCADCHSEPQGKNPEELKVRKYLEEGKEIPWVTVNRLPGHVYFSHKAHVGYAEMKCWECHRDMRKVSRPVTKPDIEQLTMKKCMECHKEKGVGLDCLKCHK